MSNALKLAAGLGFATEKLYVDDVFSTYLYTGNGSTQTINNGINLAGKGGLVWEKNRSTSQDHYLVDSNRPLNGVLRTNTTGTPSSPWGGYSFAANGYTSGINFSNGNNIASWTFRKAPKFFDIVTYTGNGVAGRQIPHSLGIAPGMIVVKSTSNTTNWAANHASLAAGNYMKLNGTEAASYNTSAFFGTHTSTTFQVGSDFDVNANGYTYVAYLFAHDDSADGIIQCGSFTTDASGNATVNLGWEPQFLLTKTKDTTGDWRITDSARAFAAAPANNAKLNPNTSAAESTSGTERPTATGFESSNIALSTTFIYLAIRRSNKPPTSGTQVYNSIARPGSSSAVAVSGVGFPPDCVMHADRQKTAWLQAYSAYDRLRGAGKYSNTRTTAAEGDLTPFVTSIGVDGVTLTNSGFNSNVTTYISHFFRRAPGFFDVVCYTGTGVARTVAHNLGAAPELMIFKARNSALSWYVLHKDYLTADSYQRLETTATTSTGIDLANATRPNATVFSLGTSAAVNGNTTTYVAYLFATLPGISKVGSYTGNGSTQTINCGFSTGARFILIKRTDSTGDWYVWDTTRGIVSANDPYLTLNSNAVEVTTDDSVDPDSTGFIVNQTAATNINVNAASYIFLAIA